MMLDILFNGFDQPELTGEKEDEAAAPTSVAGGWDALACQVVAAVWTTVAAVLSLKEVQHRDVHIYYKHHWSNLSIDLAFHVFFIYVFQIGVLHVQKLHTNWHNNRLNSPKPGPAPAALAGAAPELERARQRAKRAAQRPRRSHLEQLLDQVRKRNFLDTYSLKRYQVFVHTHKFVYNLYRRDMNMYIYVHIYNIYVYTF